MFIVYNIFFLYYMRYKTMLLSILYQLPFFVVAAATIGLHKVLAAAGTQHVIGSEINIIRRHCAHHPHPPATAQDEEPIDQTFLMKGVRTTIVGGPAHAIADAEWIHAHGAAIGNLSTLPRTSITTIFPFFPLVSCRLRAFARSRQSHLVGIFHHTVAPEDVNLFFVLRHISLIDYYS